VGGCNKSPYKLHANYEWQQGVYLKGVPRQFWAEAGGGIVRNNGEPREPSFLIAVVGGRWGGDGEGGEQSKAEYRRGVRLKKLRGYRKQRKATRLKKVSFLRAQKDAQDVTQTEIKSNAKADWVAFSGARNLTPPSQSAREQDATEKWDGQSISQRRQGRKLHGAFAGV